MSGRVIRGAGLALTVGLLSAWPHLGIAETWLEACAAIRPTIACKPENRQAIELAMEHCRAAADKPACHRRELAEPRDPAPMPTILRGK